MARALAAAEPLDPVLRALVRLECVKFHSSMFNVGRWMFDVPQIESFFFLPRADRIWSRVRSWDSALMVAFTTLAWLDDPMDLPSTSRIPTAGAGCCRGR